MTKIDILDGIFGTLDGILDGILCVVEIYMLWDHKMKKKISVLIVDRKYESPKMQYFSFSSVFRGKYLKSAISDQKSVWV